MLHPQKISMNLNGAAKQTHSNAHHLKLLRVFLHAHFYTLGMHGFYSISSSQLLRNNDDDGETENDVCSSIGSFC